MRQALSTVEFHGQELLVTTDASGQGWVAIRPICEAIGIEDWSQQRKLETDPRYSCRLMTAVGGDEKQRQMLCLPVSQLNGWLYSINSNKVRADVRENLLTYQRECQEVLYRHFMPKGGTNEEVVGLIHDLRTDMERGFVAYKVGLAEVQADMERGLGSVQADLHTRLGSVQTDLQNGFESVQAEVDELRELIHLTVSANDEKEIRSLIRQVKTQTGMDGRAIVGKVRETLGTAGIYDTPNPKQVKNVLRNMLGKGVFGVVPATESDE